MVKVWMLENKGLSPSEVDKLDKKFVSFLLERDALLSEKRRLERLER